MQMIQKYISYLFVLIFMVLISYDPDLLSTQIDVGTTQSSKLHEQTSKTLAEFNDEVVFSLFVDSQNKSNSSLQELLRRYEVASKLVTLNIYSIEKNPDYVAQKEVSAPLELVIEHKQSTQRVQYSITEHSVTLALQRLLRNNQALTIFITDHNERQIDTQSNQSYSLLGTALKQKGFQISPFSIVHYNDIPDNIEALIIAGPTIDYTKAEIMHLDNYLEDGGNALILLDSSNLKNINMLLKNKFNISIADDPLYDSADPEKTGIVYALGSPQNIVTSSIDAYMVLFQPLKLTVSGDENSWQFEPIISTTDTARTKNSDAGTNEVGYSFSRINESNSKKQQVIILSDSDIFTDSILPGGANLKLANNIFNQLLDEGKLLDLTLPTPGDQKLGGSEQSWRFKVIVIALFPFFLIGVGVYRWWRRSRITSLSNDTIEKNTDQST